MPKDGYTQVNFRLNLNSSEQLKIYRMLEDLKVNSDVSKTKFIIDAISYYMNGQSQKQLTIQDFVARTELAELENKITTNVNQEVLKYMGTLYMQTQEMVNNILKQYSLQSMPQGQQRMPQAIEIPKTRLNVEPVEQQQEVEEEDEQVDSSVAEMAMLFAQGDFEEEERT